MVRFWMLLLLGTWLCSLATGGKLRAVACQNSCILENGEVSNPKRQRSALQTGDYFKINTVSCKNGYLMNVRNIDSVWFKCTVGLWQAQTNDNTPLDLYLNNVTCKEKTTCNSPRYIENGRFIIQERFCLDVEGLPNCAGTYNSGDKIKYECDIGYQQRKLVRKPAPVEYQIDNDSDYGSYGSYEVDESDDDAKDVVELKSPNSTFQCHNDGQWRNGQDNMDEPFPVCEKIICNASRFENVTGGIIKNFTSLYEYGAILELECDPGFQPIKYQDLLQCFDPANFETADFGCTKTKCPKLVKPIRGDVYLLNKTRYVGDMARFSCDFKHTLSGPNMMTCLENGQWNSEYCVRCTPTGADCPPPCMHEDNFLKTADPSFTHGSVIELYCQNNPAINITRTCLITNRWNGSDLYCKEKTDPLKSMVIAYSLTKAMQSLKNPSNDSANDDGLVAKTIDIGQPGGVDVFFVLDVSGSISASEFKRLKKFTLALTSKLNVSDSSDGTRLMVYAFASSTHLLFNGHGLGTIDVDKILKNTEEALDVLRKILNMTQIRSPVKDGTIIDIGQGTNIKGALNDIIIEIDTKKSNPNNKVRPFSQQVVVLISDGESNNGKPTDPADILKEKMDVQIYSIYLGSGLDTEKLSNTAKGKKTMQDLASKRPNEEHYFEINSKNFDSVIDDMIKTTTEIQCGTGDPFITNLGTSVKQKITAKRHAWPWMVAITYTTVLKDTQICGGSLINKNHVLTAAHCFYDQDGEKSKKKFKLIIGANNIDTQSSDRREETFNWNSITVHPGYKQNVKPKHLYDIAVVTLKTPIETYNYAVRPICIPDDDRVFDAIQEKMYGVSTGWGGKETQLQQRQMLIKDDADCLKMIKDHQHDQFDRSYMFCAGGEKDTNVNTVQGDSGGPFIIEDPNKENTFVQIGIVSFDFKESNRTGFYTELKELREWINETITDMDDKKG